MPEIEMSDATRHGAKKRFMLSCFTGDAKTVQTSLKVQVPVLN